MGITLGEHVDEASSQVFAQLLALVDGGAGAGAGPSEWGAALFIVCSIRSSSLDITAEQPWQEWLGRDDVTHIDLGQSDYRSPR